MLLYRLCYFTYLVTYSVNYFLQEAENKNIEKNEVVFETPDDESVNDSKNAVKVACYLLHKLICHILNTIITYIFFSVLCRKPVMILTHWKVF